MKKRKKYTILVSIVLLVSLLVSLNLSKFSDISTETPSFLSNVWLSIQTAKAFN